jgi:hypothetical protein
VFADKLRGTGTLSTNNTNAEYAGGATSGLNSYTNTGVVIGTNSNPIYAFNYATLPYILYQFQRAPSFFDEVCYTGNGSTQNINHNLQAVPELVIFKNRSTAVNWRVCFDFTATDNNNAVLNTTASANRYNYGILVFNSIPTSTVLPLYSYSQTNGSGNNIVAYLFATCVGVSKVGLYTGNGTTQAISCGFTGGARFVLIKSISSSNWFVYDTARGITTLTDPYLTLNTTDAETATLGSVTSTTGGFSLNNSISPTLNSNGENYLFLAIA